MNDSVPFIQEGNLPLSLSRTIGFIAFSFEFSLSFQFISLKTDYEKAIYFLKKEENDYSMNFGSTQKPEKYNAPVLDPFLEESNLFGIKSPSPAIDIEAFEPFLGSAVNTPNMHSGFNSRKPTPCLRKAKNEGEPVSEKAKMPHGHNALRFSQISTQNIETQSGYFDFKLEKTMDFQTVNHDSSQSQGINTNEAHLSRETHFNEGIMRSQATNPKGKNVGTKARDGFQGINHPNKAKGIPSQMVKAEAEMKQEKEAHPSTSKPNKSKEPTVFCQCSKSECLKFYCQCFKNGVPCNSKCTCISCSNIEHLPRREEAMWILNQHTINSQPQSQDKGESTTTTGGINQNWKQTDHLALGSFQQLAMDQKGRLYVKNGCSCKKIKCQKKYCMCYESGVACTELCRCDVCHNKVVHSKKPNEKPKNETSEKSNAKENNQKSENLQRKSRRRDHIHDKYNFHGFGRMEAIPGYEEGFIVSTSAGFLPSQTSEANEEVFSAIVKPHSGQDTRTISPEDRPDLRMARDNRLNKNGKDLSEILAELDETEGDTKPTMEIGRAHV